MKKLEIYFQDLTPEAQNAVLELESQKDANWDSFPIFTLEVY